jgi:hypothetical protein
LRGVKVSRHLKKGHGGGLVSDVVVRKLGGKVVVLLIVIRESEIFV